MIRVSTSPPPEVLVVDDERHLADLHASWLAGDYGVRVAYDGDEAIEALDESVDVVLLDRRMPGPTGDEVLAVAREREYGCRVAMVTAVEPDVDVIDMGFDDYLVKPASAEEIRATVDRLLTRNSYDEQVDEYARLLSKKAALEAQKSRNDLERSCRFAELESRIELVGSNVDTMVRRFDDDDVVAVLRDLPAGQGA